MQSTMPPQVNNWVMRVFFISSLLEMLSTYCQSVTLLARVR